MTMKRRKFLEIAALTPLAATVLPPIAHAQIPPTRPSRGGFPPRDPGPATYEPTGPGIQVRFLGTGAADWNGPSAGGELRRHASILADGKVLFDYTPSAADMVPAGLHPEVIFYTHSHSDHYHPKSALELGVRRVYLGETWLERGTRDFERAAEETGRPMPEIIPLRLGQAVEQDGLTVTPLPANHQSNHVTEETLIFLIEKDSTRLLYATDTGGLTARATGYAGIGQFTRERKFLTGIIMEATMPIDYKPFIHPEDLAAAREVLAAGIGLLVPDCDVHEAGHLLWLARLAVLVGLVDRQAEFGDRDARGRLLQLRIPGEVAKQNHLVERCHTPPPSRLCRDYTARLFLCGGVRLRGGLGRGGGFSFGLGLAAGVLFDDEGLATIVDGEDLHAEDLVVERVAGAELGDLGRVELEADADIDAGVLLLHHAGERLLAEKLGPEDIAAQARDVAADLLEEGLDSVLPGGVHKDIQSIILLHSGFNPVLPASASPPPWRIRR